METIGIDFAAQPKNTAAVVLEWDESGGHGRRGCLHEVLTDDAIVDLLAARPRAQVGIDSPFGWPVEFRKAIARWSRTGRWPDGVEICNLRLRLTDHFVHEKTGRYPLSVSTDRIGVAAFRCAGLLTRLGARARIVEVYPAAARLIWDLPPKGKKSPKAVLELITEAHVDLDQTLQVRCVESDHCLDALICALVARATSLGLTEKPPADRRETTLEEGWIELPVERSLRLLAAGAQPGTVPEHSP